MLSARLNLFRITIFIILAVFLMGSFMSKTAVAKPYYFLESEGVITNFTYKYVKQGIDIASRNDGVLVIKLDTPGGLLSSTRKIVQLIFESDIKIVTFVSPQGARAGSAGTFIVLASDYAVMAEGTNIGAAHPVNITGKDLEGDLRLKIENDTLAFIKSIAEKRNRNIDEAMDMVSSSKSFTASEALKFRLIDAIGNNDEQIIDKANTFFGFNSKPTRHVIKPSLTEKIAFFLSDPNILMMLLFIGFLSIFLEFKMPGTFIFAAMGITSIVLFMFGINIIPINFIGLLLIVVGIVLIVSEIFIPSFGLLTIASIASLSAGMVLLFKKEDNMNIEVSLSMIIIITFFIAGVALFIGRLILKDLRKKPVTGMGKLIEEVGTVVEWDNDSGKIYVHGEIWNAISENEFLKDDIVVVIEFSGMLLRVEPEKKIFKDSN